MIRAEDVKAGIAEHKPKACTSVLPYLKSKQIHVENNPAVKGSGRKPQVTPPEKGGGSGESDPVVESSGNTLVTDMLIGCVPHRWLKGM